jgi:hypothetical protein
MQPMDWVVFVSVIVADSGESVINFIQLVLLRWQHDRAGHFWQRCGARFLVLLLLGMHNQPSH